MDSRAKEILKIGDAMFSKKGSIDSLNQEIALNFCPHLADFTTKRDDGEEFSDHLFSSYPVIACRELTNIIPSYLRPRGTRWVNMHVQDKSIDDSDEERRWLEYATEILWRALYDERGNFVRAARETDEFFIAFGNGVLKFGKNIAGDGLFFQNFHLRDNAWSENAEGRVDCNHRNWNPTARQLKHHFPETISTDVRKACEKDPEKEFKCRHVVVPTRLYDYKTRAGRRFPYTSLYIERDTETVLEEVGLSHFPYVIPRWRTISGSPYGRSMAADTALPDGRTMQIVERVIREAGEKYVDPPMIAIGDAIRGDVSLYAGGITQADMEYDERLGEVLRPVTQDKGGFPIGFEIRDALKQDIQQAFFLDKIRIPDLPGTATAYQVRKIVEQSLRAQAPLAEPIEQEYNTPLCEGVFQLLLENGAFGPVDEMPERLRGQDVQFTFRSPLAEMTERNDAEIFKEAMAEIVAPVAQIDPAQVAQIDWTQATRDALRGSGFKATWLAPLDAIKKRQEEMQRQATLAKGVEGIDALGAATEAVGRGAKALQPNP